MEKDVIMKLNDVTLYLFNYMAYHYKNLNLDITPIQARIILAIYNNKEMPSQKRIEGFVPCNKSTISNILKTMEKNGLIKKVDNATDLRRKSIVLTAKSENIISILNKDKERLLKDLTEGISKEEMDSFNDVLIKFKYNIERCKND